jgi:hypothetical protein
MIAELTKKAKKALPWELCGKCGHGYNSGET